MNRRLPLIVALALTGCQSITIPTPMGPATAKSFGQRTTISQLHWSTNGVLSLKGYNNDQASTIAEVVGAAVEAAAKGAKP